MVRKGDRSVDEQCLTVWIITISNPNRSNTHRLHLCRGPTESPLHLLCRYHIKPANNDNNDNNNNGNLGTHHRDISMSWQKIKIFHANLSSLSSLKWNRQPLYTSYRCHSGWCTMLKAHTWFYRTSFHCIHYRWTFTRKRRVEGGRAKTAGLKKRMDQSQLVVWGRERASIQHYQAEINTCFFFFPPSHSEQKGSIRNNNEWETESFKFRQGWDEFWWVWWDGSWWVWWDGNSRAEKSSKRKNFQTKKFWPENNVNGDWHYLKPERRCHRRRSRCLSHPCSIPNPYTVKRRFFW